ncbi:unnamed protein product [Victoria cruziana]
MSPTAVQSCREDSSKHCSRLLLPGTAAVEKFFLPPTETGHMGQYIPQTRLLEAQDLWAHLHTSAFSPQ